MYLLVKMNYGCGEISLCIFIRMSQVRGMLLWRPYICTSSWANRFTVNGMTQGYSPHCLVYIVPPPPPTLPPQHLPPRRARVPSHCVACLAAVSSLWRLPACRYSTVDFSQGGLPARSGGGFRVGGEERGGDGTKPPECWSFPSLRACFAIVI